VTLWIAVYAVGAVQAAMLAAALWRREANPRANRILAAWLAIIAADLAVKATWLATHAPAWRTAWIVATLLPSLYASLFYLYVRALTTGRGLRPRDLLHASVPAATGAAMLLRFAAGAMPSDHGGWHAAWFDPLLFGWAAFWLGAALLRVQRYRRGMRERRADADRLSLRWIVVLAACQLVIWTIAVLQWRFRLPYVDYFLIYGAVAAWVCIVGWSSLAHPPVVELPEQDAAAPGTPGADAGGAGATAADDDPRFPEVEARLARLMQEEALYREPALAIGKLARRSGYPEYLVSAVINRRLGGNFWEYVNRHRIAAACAALADPADTRTILEIAYDVGFTSKSTFNASFKRLTGATPSAWRAGATRAAAGSTPRG